MSGKRPGAGVRVSGGKLRVDAARAVEKLRSYQLADPLAWVLEVVRAGTLLEGVTHVAVEGGAGDVFVALVGASLDPARVVRLFEELVDPSSGPEARALRLLAMGVNAALGRVEAGAATRHVDVLTIEDGAAMRVRFTPQLFAVERETGLARALRSLAAEPAMAPPHAPRVARGILVHARAVTGLAVLARWAVGEEPRELALVRDAAREVRVPLTVQGLPVPADPSILLREPLPGGGWVAVTTPRSGRTTATLEAAEMGIVLSREAWASGIGEAGARVPLVARIDRERLPTNAARSAVRWDEPLAASGLEEASEGLGRLIARLAGEIDATSEPARLSWLREAALTLLAADVRGVAFRTRIQHGAVASVLEPLLDAKLLYDAIGRRRTPRALAAAPETSVHDGRTHVDPALAPWLGDVLAAPPGDPTHLLFGDLPPASAEALIQRATAARAMQAQWRARPIEPAVVSGAEHAVARVRLPAKLTVKGREPITLAGEVALGLEGSERVTVLRVGGRSLEVRRVHAGVGIVAVVDSDALAPTMDYDAAQDDDALRAVLGAVEAAVRQGCDAIATALVGGTAREPSVTLHAEELGSSPRAAALVRYAIVCAVARDADHAPASVSRQPLGRARVWPRVDGGACSIDELAAADAIGVIDPRGGAPGRVPTGRPLLVPTDAERTALRVLLPRARIVDYGGARGPQRALADRTLSLAGPLEICLRERGDSFERLAAWSRGESGIEAFHAGVRLGFRSTRTVQPAVVVAVDEDRIVPDETWSHASVDHAMLEDRHDPIAASGRIARAVWRAWLGETSPELFATVPLDAPHVVRNVLGATRAARLDPPSDDERRALRTLSIWPRLATGTVSADVLLEAGRGRIPFVPEGVVAPALARELPMEALLGTRAEAEGLSMLVGGKGALDVSPTALAALVQAARQRKLTSLLQRPIEPLDPWGCAPTTRVLGDGLEGLVGYRPGASAPRVSLLVERRRLLDLEDPSFPPHVAAKVSIDTALLDEDADAPTAAALVRLRGALLASSRELVKTVVAQSPESLFAERPLGALVDHLTRGNKRRGEVGVLLDTLAALPTLRTTHGTTVAIARAIVDGTLPVVTDAISWVEPEDEPPTPYDRAIPMVSWGASDERFLRLQKVAGVPIRDVTDEVRALHAARRARRGLVARPALRRDHEPRLARTIEELVSSLADADALRAVLGFGAIGLSADARAIVRFFDAGQVAHEMSLDLAPPFEAALESPRVGHRRAPTEAVRQEVEGALVTVLSQLLRRLADEGAFDGAPSWALEAQLDAALLGGATHLERLGGLRLFPTTDGTRVSYETLRTQQAKLGTVWWTPDPSSTAMPLDSERIALRLSAAHASALGRAIKLTEATRELELDRIAAANRARPPVTSIAADERERAAAIAVALDHDDAEGETMIAPLWPRFAAMRTLVLHLGLQLLGPTDAPGEIPVLARARSSRFVPDRTWSGAVGSPALAAVARTVADTAEKLVMQAIEVPRSVMPTVAVDRAFMQSVPHPVERVIRGRLTLGPLDLDEHDEEGVLVVDTTVLGPEQAVALPLSAAVGKRAPAVVPLEGTLILWGADRESAEGTLGAVASAAYAHLIGRIAGRLAADKSPDADLDRAHLVRAAELGHVRPKDVPDLPLPCGRGALATLHGAVKVLAASSPVVVLAPGQDDAHPALARQPALLDDGSLTARRLLLALGPRALSRSDALALALGATEARASEVSDAPPRAAPDPESGGAVTTKKKKTKKVVPTAGPVEPLALRTRAMLDRVDVATAVSVRASRATPIAQIDLTELSLAGASELLALAAGTGLHRERSAVLLAAYAASTLEPPTALRALARLLE